MNRLERLKFQDNFVLSEKESEKCADGKTEKQNSKEVDFQKHVTDMAKHWWQDKKLGTKHVFWLAIITGLLSGIVSSYLYGYVVQPLISPPQKPNLVIVYTQTTDFQHLISISYTCIFSIMELLQHNIWIYR